jgi:hypothetical protein
MSGDEDSRWEGTTGGEKRPGGGITVYEDGEGEGDTVVLGCGCG